MLPFARMFRCCCQEKRRKNPDNNEYQCEAQTKHETGHLSDVCMQKIKKQKREHFSEPTFATQPIHQQSEPTRSKSAHCLRLSHAEREHRRRLSDIQQLENYMRSLRRTANGDLVPILPNRLCCAQLIQTALVRREREYIKQVLHNRIHKRRHTDFGTPAKNNSNNDESLDINSNPRQQQNGSGSSERVSFSQSGSLSVRFHRSSNDTGRKSRSSQEESCDDETDTEVASNTVDDDQEKVRPSQMLSFMESDNDDWLAAYRSKHDFGGKRLSVPTYLLDAL